MTNKPIAVIGDVSGHDKALVRLLAKLPETSMIVFVGDVIDRGSGSKECMDMVMDLCKQGKAVWLLGNHEHMMVDFYRGTREYERGVWLANGGSATRRNLEGVDVEPYLQFIENECSVMFEADAQLGDGATKHLFVTHAPVRPDTRAEFVEALDKDESNRFMFGAIWNRNAPDPWFTDKGIPILTVHGHNGRFQEFRQDGNPSHLYSVCIDNSHRGEIKALLWPEMKYVAESFEQDYLR